MAVGGIDPRHVRSALLSHPGVAQAEVTFLADGDPVGLLARVVPTQAALRTKRIADRERVESWRQIYEAIYQDDVPDRSNEFTGWLSSADRRPISAAEMTEWRDATVESILSLRPARILEIGGGLGMVMTGLLPHCAEYWATDISATATSALQARTAGDRQGHRVEVRTQPADVTEGLPAAYFDTVVLNSVIQYFPSVEYLIKVLAGAMHVASAGGRIFVGDVRNRKLLRYFRSGVAVMECAENSDIRKVRESALRAAARETELCVDPEFFYCLNPRLSAIANAEVRLKRGRLNSEMTAYRYDVVLHKQPGHSLFTSVAHTFTWGLDVTEVDAVKGLLSACSASPVEIVGIPNARLDSDRRATAALSQCPTIACMRSRLSGQHGDAVDPERLHRLGAELDLDVRLRWTLGRDDGAFDALFAGRGQVPAETPRWSAGRASASRLAAFANDPLAAGAEAALEQDLKKHLSKVFQGFQVPVHFAFTDQLRVDGDQAGVQGPPMAAAPVCDGTDGVEEMSCRTKRPNRASGTTW